jgi:hypothetical protein
VADTELGASGTPTGVSETGDDAVPEPMAFSAVTVTAYVVPSVSPVTVASSWLAGTETEVGDPEVGVAVTT